MSCPLCGKFGEAAAYCTQPSCPHTGHMDFSFTSSSSTAQKSNKISKSNKNSNSLTEEDAAAFAVLVISGMAVAVAAVAEISEATYNKTLSILENKRGKRSSNSLIAFGITATVMTSPLTIYGAYSGYREYIHEKYPAISIHVNPHGTFFSDVSPEKETASQNSLDSCKKNSAGKCREAIVTEIREPICIAIAPSLSSSIVYRNIFREDESDKLTSDMGMCVTTSIFHKLNISDCDVGEISYFCNSNEMRETLDKVINDRDSITEMVSSYKTDQHTNLTTPIHTHPQPLPKSETFPTTPPPVREKFFQISGGNLNLRVGPGTNYKVKATLAADSCVYTKPEDKTSGGFQEVWSYASSGGYVHGFVSAKYLRPTTVAASIEECRAVLK